MKDGQAVISLPVGHSKIQVQFPGRPPTVMDVYIRWRGDRATVRVTLNPEPVTVPPAAEHELGPRIWTFGLSPDSRTLYAGVPDPEDEKLENLTTFQMEPWKQVGMLPINHEVTPVYYKAIVVAGPYLYATIHNEPTLLRIDLRDNSQSTLPLFQGKYPFIHTMRLAPNRRWLVIQGGMDSNPSDFGPNERLYLVDIGNGAFKLRDTMSFDGELTSHSIGFSADSQSCYVVTRNGNGHGSKLHKVRLVPKCEIINSGPVLGDWPVGVAYSNRLDRVFVTDLSIWRVQAFDGTTLVPRPESDIETDSWSPSYLSFYEPADLLAVSTQNGPLLLLNTRTRTVVSRIKVQGSPAHLEFSRDGTRLYASYGFSRGALVVVDTEPMLATILMASRQAGNNDNLCRLSATGGSLEKLDLGAGRYDNAQNRSPQWSPDGTQIGFISDASASPRDGQHQLHVNVLNILTGRANPFHDARVSTVGDTFLAWSPDGQKLAYVRQDGKAIGLLDLPTGDITTMLSADEVDTSQARFGKDPFFERMTWSAATGELYVSFLNRANSVQQAVFRFAPRTRTVTHVGGGGESGIFADPAVSPDGSHLVVVCQLPNEQEKDKHLVIMNADGNGQKRVPGQLGAACESPCWWPDGKSVVYVAQNPERERKIFRVDISSGSVEQLTKGPGDYRAPAVFRGCIMPISQNARGLSGAGSSASPRAN